MFHPDKDFRYIVLETLTEEGKSISALSKELNAKGYKINRLLLTGYLRALTDLRIVKEKTVPPSKIYIPIKGRERDIYQILAEKALELFPPDKAAAVVLYSLNHLTRRAIFADEIVRAGFDNNIPGRQATPEERAEAKKLLSRSGFKIPDSARAYVAEEDLETEHMLLMEALLLQHLDAYHLVKDTKQTKLSF